MRRAASAAPDLPGFVYQRLLGAGGFSDVFLYQQNLPRRQVAVKVLLAEDLTPAARKAFVDEANLMAQLSAHPFIVTIHGADIAEGDHPYFVMEYCAGASLSERYKRERFSAEDALRTGVRLASAIATAHAAGILHRDIKPANVLTNEYGWPALTDFGISSAVDELPAMTTTTGSLRDGDTAGSTESQSVGLSVPWSPPEMFADDPRPDVRSDVFSLAATIWTLLAGRTPFELPGRGNGALDLIGRIERGRITPMDRTDVPRSLVAVLQKGMSPRREDRWQTAVEFARALQRVELELGYTATTIDVPALAQDAAPASAGDGAGADETRMRSVATVDAQPARPPAPTRVEPDDRTRVRNHARPSAVEEGTVLRAARPAASAAPVVVDPQGSASRAAPSGADPTPPGRRRGTVLAVAGAAVIVAVVAVAVAVTGGGTDPDPRPAASGGSALGGDPVPRPKFLSATPSDDGTAVSFRFDAVADADAYSWAPSEQPDATQQVAEPMVVRTGVTPGTRVCVDILAIRAGRTSETTEACYPP
ncbi:MAG: serine/threonine protein kinase [Micrococcales bacterium]|nr:serine/threonine protein kinase [Micrococcales bacterium]